MAVPAYFTPGAGDHWSRLVRAGGRAGYVVINAEDGPGPGPAAEYRQVTDAARRAGQHVLGYVWTDYGARPRREVARDVTRYAAWYGVRSFFLDGVPTAARHARRYQDYVEMIRRWRGTVMLNPGALPDRSYFRVGDVVVAFEGPASDYADGSYPDTRSREVPGGQVCHLVYGAAARDLPGVLHLARRRGVRYLYVTDGTPPNPWDRLPSYWDAELSAVGGEEETGAVRRPSSPGAR